MKSDFENFLPICCMNLVTIFLFIITIIPEASLNENVLRTAFSSLGIAMGISSTIMFVSNMIVNKIKDNK